MINNNIELNEEDIFSSHFNLDIGVKGLRIGHCNVNHLNTGKFEQIKLYLLGNLSSSKPQLDALFLSETFLKPIVRDSLYAVPGFSIYRKERKSKSGGGVMAFINHDLHVKRRSDLENQNVESLWLEICPFKSKRSIIVGSIYRPPSSNNANDIDIESNIEGVHLQNKETIIVSDINIDYMNKSSYNKHKLAKGLRGMHFKQLVDFITRPISKSCLDHVYCNQPQRIKNISTHNILDFPTICQFLLFECMLERMLIEIMGCTLNTVI